MRIAYCITTCGKKKSKIAAPAKDFYQGSFVKLQRKAALALNPIKGTLVLSNKYGFMHPDFIIPEPYDSHWGYPDTMIDEKLLAQIDKLGLEKNDVIVVFGAEEYVKQTKRLFPEFTTIIWAPKILPIDKRRMGYQIKLYKEISKVGRLPYNAIKTAIY